MPVLVAFKKSLEKKSTVANETKLGKIPEKFEEFCKLLTIRSGNKLVRFQLYEHQKELIRCIDNYRGVVGVKSRQLGATQVVVAKFLHKACLNPAYSALVFAKTQQDTSLIAYRCREMIRSLDGLIEMENDNLQTLRIAGGGTIFFRNSTIDGARGIDSVSDILYDEAAFPKDIDKLYGASEATQSMVGDEARTVILSTPNGASGWYFEIANGNNPKENDLLATIEKVRSEDLPPILSWEDNDGWCKYIAYWKCHPIYSQDENYLENIAKKRKLPMSQVRQEYDLDFTEAIDKPFSYDLVKSFCHGRWSKKVRDDCHYYITIDCQFGGADYFVAGVTEHDLVKNEFRLVDLYRKNHQRKSYHKKKVKWLINKYNPEKIGIEKNSGGQIYVEEIEEEFPQIPVIPIVTTQGSKKGMLEKLLIQMEDETFSVPNDKDIKGELQAFTRIGDKMEAAQGSHDDIVMMLLFQMIILPIVESSGGLDLDEVNVDA